MNTCPNCGKMAGLHSSILQGCMCQYSMQAMKEGKDFTVSKPWVSLTDEEIWKYWWNRPEVPDGGDDSMEAEFVAAVRTIEAKLREKNA